MIRPLLLLPLAALLVLAPAAQAVSAEAVAPCVGGLCDTINAACEAVFGNGCIPRGSETARCMGTPCDEINAVCILVFGWGCLG